MKVAPVSADLLIKLAVGAVVVGAAWYLLRKGQAALGEAITSITSLPGKAIGKVVESAKQGGGAWQDQYSLSSPPSISNASGYGGKYKGPLVNDAGMDFGLF